MSNETKKEPWRRRLRLRATTRFFAALGLLLSTPRVSATVSTELLDCVRSGIQHGVPLVSSVRDRDVYFRQIGQAIQSRRARIRELLLKVDTLAGADLELDLVHRQLEGLPELEFHDLTHVGQLENVAVYASTNVPLYTLVSHALIPGSVARNVWFRTPEATRQLYLDLFREIASALPPGSLDHVHLLTEARDVQYDNFNRMHVMGLNQNGTRSLRKPAEVVIFTGSPEVAQTILARNLSTTNQLSGSLGSFKQLFLGFQAGANPMVITQSARRNLEDTVRQSLEPVRINCGQDCMAPNFYAVHAKVVRPYVASLLSQIRRLRAGENSDPRAGYTPLTMTKSFDRLQKYRDDYREFLVNPDATLDSRTKLVSPHVFLFPNEMFDKVRMQEHFGPYFSLFSYQSRQDLDRMAKDPRVQRQAMYATVLGGRSASPEASDAARAFQESKHGVVVNQTLFGDMNANFPFGGKGPDTSNVVTLENTPGRSPRVTAAHRPALFSREAARVFGTPKSDPAPLLHSRADAKAYLDVSLERTRGDPANVPEIKQDEWSWIIEPQNQARPRGLQEIRKAIRARGLTLYLPEPRPDNPSAAKEFEDFFGARVVFETDITPSDEMVRVPGVVLQTVSDPHMVDTLNRYRGDINPFLGFGTLHGLLKNKLSEARIIEAIAPELALRTESFADLSKAGWIDPSFEPLRKQVRALLDRSVRTEGKLDERTRQELRNSLVSLTEIFLKSVRRHFPEGAFIKNFGDFATADMGTQVTSFSTSAQAVASEFLRRFEAVRDSGIAKTKGVDSRRYSGGILENSWENGTKFLNALITEPDRILIQGRVELARTDMGFPLEFRVDFIDGEPLIARPRYSHEYYPEELEEAKRQVAEFFRKAPPDFRYLSGGADIGKLADGRWAIFELNPGGYSGTLEPRYFPIEANQLYSELQEKPTPLIARLEQAAHGGWDAERKFLEGLEVAKPVWWRERMARDLSVVEAARWFRDRHLKAWAQSGSTDWVSADSVLSGLKRLFSGFPESAQDDLSDLEKGARHFVERKIGGRIAAAVPTPPSTVPKPERREPRNESRADIATRAKLYGSIRGSSPKIFDLIRKAGVSAPVGTVTAEGSGRIEAHLASRDLPSGMTLNEKNLGFALSGLVESLRMKARSHPVLREIGITIDAQAGIPSPLCKSLGLIWSEERAAWITSWSIRP